METKDRFKREETSVVNKCVIYHLTKDIQYVIQYSDDIETYRHLSYIGKDINGGGIMPIYKNDISLLKTENPYHDNYDWLETDKLPSVEEIDLEKIIFVSSYSHSFYQLDKTPIPVIEKGSYIGTGLHNGNYDLVKLREHLLGLDCIVSVSEILDIPYYNVIDEQTQYLDVTVLPSQEVMDMVTQKKSRKDIIFSNIIYREKGFDFLNIRQFLNKK